METASRSLSFAHGLDSPSLSRSSSYSVLEGNNPFTIPLQVQSSSHLSSDAGSSSALQALYEGGSRGVFQWVEATAQVSQAVKVCLEQLVGPNTPGHVKRSAADVLAHVCLGRHQQCSLALMSSDINDLLCQALKIAACSDTRIVRRSTQLCVLLLLCSLHQEQESREAVFGRAERVAVVLQLCLRLVASRHLGTAGEAAACLLAPLLPLLASQAQAEAAARAVVDLLKHCVEVGGVEGEGLGAWLLSEHSGSFAEEGHAAGGEQEAWHTSAPPLALRPPLFPDSSSGLSVVSGSSSSSGFEGSGGRISDAVAVVACKVLHALLHTDTHSSRAAGVVVEERGLAPLVALLEGRGAATTAVQAPALTAPETASAAAPAGSTSAQPARCTADAILGGGTVSCVATELGVWATDCLFDVMEVCSAEGAAAQGQVEQEHARVVLLVCAYLQQQLLVKQEPWHVLLGVDAHEAGSLTTATQQRLRAVISTLSQEQQCAHFKALAAAALTMADFAVKQAQEYSASMPGSAAAGDASSGGTSAGEASGTGGVLSPGDAGSSVAPEGGELHHTVGAEGVKEVAEEEVMQHLKKLMQASLDQQSRRAYDDRVRARPVGEVEAEKKDEGEEEDGKIEDLREHAGLSSQSSSGCSIDEEVWEYYGYSGQAKQEGVAEKEKEVGEGGEIVEERQEEKGADEEEVERKKEPEKGEQGEASEEWGKSEAQWTKGAEKEEEGKREGEKGERGEVSEEQRKSGAEPAKGGQQGAPVGHDAAEAIFDLLGVEISPHIDAETAEDLVMGILSFEESEEEMSFALGILKDILENLGGGARSARSARGPPVPTMEPTTQDSSNAMERGQADAGAQEEVQGAEAKQRAEEIEAAKAARMKRMQSADACSHELQQELLGIVEQWQAAAALEQELRQKLQEAPLPEDLSTTMLNVLSTRELKAMLQARGMECAQALEKGELVQALVQDADMQRGVMAGYHRDLRQQLQQAVKAQRQAELRRTELKQQLQAVQKHGGAHGITEGNQEQVQQQDAQESAERQATATAAAAAAAAAAAQQAVQLRRIQAREARVSQHQRRQQQQQQQRLHQQQQQRQRQLQQQRLHQQQQRQQPLQQMRQQQLRQREMQQQRQQQRIEFQLQQQQQRQQRQQQRQEQRQQQHHHQWQCGGAGMPGWGRFMLGAVPGGRSERGGGIAEVMAEGVAEGVAEGLAEAKRFCSSFRF